MPLSEHEQKLLDQMERALYAEDPRFATHMKGRGPGTAGRRRIVVGACVALVGLGLVIAGVSNSLIVLGVIGFALMVGGVAWAATPVRTRPTVQSVDAHGRQGAPRATGQGATKAKATKRTKRPGQGGSFVQRMEERWERRRRDQQGW